MDPYSPHPCSKTWSVHNTFKEYKRGREAKPGVVNLSVSGCPAWCHYWERGAEDVQTLYALSYNRVNVSSAQLKPPLERRWVISLCSQAGCTWADAWARRVWRVWATEFYSPLKNKIKSLVGNEYWAKQVKLRKPNIMCCVSHVK